MLVAFACRRDDGDVLQSALKSLTGQYTVPNVFIRGTSRGGCDEIVALHEQGALQPLVESRSNSRLKTH